MEQLTKFDNSLRTTLGRVIHSAVSDQSWSQATLPLRLGGLGLRTAHASADAAYTASCNSARLSPPVTMLF